MPSFDQIEGAVAPILPGLIVAVIFIFLIVILRLRFRGDVLGERLKRPVSIFYVYFALFGVALAAKLYFPTFYRISYLVSLFVLTLAVILALSVGLFDLFLGRYRQVKVPVILRDIVILIVYVVVIVIVIGQEGVDVTSIITTSAVLTAIIGFALQDLLSNIISGLAIEIERPFRVGDWVRFNEQEGKVLEINWRSTKIETLHRDIVIIPNNVATRSPIINFSAPTRVHRRKLSIGLRYEAAPNRVKESLLAAVSSVQGVLNEPAPYVLLRSYDDFSIAYKLLFFIDDFTNRERIEDRVRSRVWYQLKRDGLSVPFPIRDINVRTVSAEEEERRRIEAEHERRSLLEQVPFLEPLSDEERTILAQRLRSEFYAQDEPIIRQGEPGSSFYIIATGAVEVRVRDQPGARERAVTGLGAHEFFGEMSLMTGEDRTATVVATRDTECYVIDKAAFRAIIAANETLVEAISDHLLKRQQELDAHRQETRAAKKRDQVVEQRTLISRIRRFFQL